ncbi:MAG: DUF4230 domain-containing protein, partial [Saprospiraceae bacterium]
MIRTLLPYLLVTVLALLLGAAALQLFRGKQAETTARAEATVLLERVRQVCQLVTVEGEFSETYNEKNTKNFTLYLPLPSQVSFSRTALLQVKGRVLVGYDMEGVSVSTDSLAKTVTISNLPQPKILAVDHELIYRNLDESWFNSFEPEDFTQLNRNAKRILQEKAVESGLLDKAVEQGNALLESITYMARAVGYTVVV